MHSPTPSPRGSPTPSPRGSPEQPEDEQEEQPEEIEEDKPIEEIEDLEKQSAEKDSEQKDALQVAVEEQFAIADAERAADVMMQEHREQNDAEQLAKPKPKYALKPTAKAAPMESEDSGNHAGYFISSVHLIFLVCFSEKWKFQAFFFLGTHAKKVDKLDFNGIGLPWSSLSWLIDWDSQQNNMWPYLLSLFSCENLSIPFFSHSLK